MSRYFLLALLTCLAAPHVSYAQDAPTPAAEVPGRMKLPEGFQATLFAGEPDVVQPIAFTFDERGRMWVVECYSYPDWEDGIQDRVLIFEDRDGDGRFDSRKVFWDGGVNLSGIAVGFGGVWLCATPNFIFVPDKDRDDVPDGEAVVHLDGWSLEAKHNVFNALTWGPDGWLYGCNGILATSMVGKPGTPEDKRTPMNCGVWRFHPIKHTFEVVAHGTTNPWGLDFDDYGEMFITNCVIAHLWHVVPGAHYERMYGQDFNPYLYGLMQSCADHLHWAGGHWTSSRGGEGKHSDAGGGHAHAGAMVYLGDNWPDEYRNRVFTCNIHGARVNQDVLEQKGSGYVAHHADDFVKVADPWFRGLGVQYGPDGGVYVTDWNDTGECHDYEEVERKTGRIYKITYGKPKPFQRDLWKMSDDELVELQLHKNDWLVRTARHVLYQRAAAGKDMAKAAQRLVDMLEREQDVRRKLRALWALNLVGGLDEQRLDAQLQHENEHVRSWAIRMLMDRGKANSYVAGLLYRVAGSEQSPRVRLALASALQRLEYEDRWKVVPELVKYAEDAEDANLPLMMWYGIEPLVSANPDRALFLIEDAKIYQVRQYIARRLTDLFTAREAGSSAPSAASPSGLDPLVEVLARVRDTAVQEDILIGMYAALEGRKNIDMPKLWPAVYERLSRSEQKEVRDQANLVALVFGDRKAVENLSRTATSKNADPDERQQALQSLLNAQTPDLLPLLESLLQDEIMRGPALRGMAAYNNEQTPQRILGVYGKLSPQERTDAIGTLASRPDFAAALIKASDGKKIPAADLSAFSVRQLLALNEPRITERLNEIWGTVRAPGKDKGEAMARYKQMLQPDDVAGADLAHGHMVFNRTCSSCHKLFGEGGAIGPDLTGSQRNNLDYVLENLLDPSAVVGHDYRMTLVQTGSGRVITGIVREETDEFITMQTPTESVIVPKDEIEQRELSPLSMMPEGMLEQFSPEDLRALVAYLANAEQVPLPTERNANADATKASGSAR